MDNNILKKNFIWNVLGTTCNAFNSLFFMVVVTRMNGIHDAGIFTLAFSFACLVFTIGVYAGRVFQVTENQNYSDTDYLLHRGISIILMIIVSFLYIYIQGYTGKKYLVLILLCLFKGQEAFCDTVYGIFQLRGHLYLAGFSMFIKAIFSLILFVVVDYVTRDLVLACIIINLVWVGLFLLFDLPHLKIEIRSTKIAVKKSLLLFKRGIFAFLFTFLTIYIVNAPKYTMDVYQDANLQAIFGMILMPATIVSLCGQYLLNPYLNHMKDAFKNNDKLSFIKITKKMSLMLLVLGTLIIITMKIIGIRIMSFIYNVDFNPYTIEIIAVITGGILYAIALILSTALTTMRQTFIQFIINSIVSVIGLFGSIFAIKYLGLQGAVLIYFIIMLSQVSLYYISYQYFIRKIFV